MPTKEREKGSLDVNYLSAGSLGVYQKYNCFSVVFMDLKFWLRQNLGISNILVIKSLKDN